MDIIMEIAYFLGLTILSSALGTLRNVLLAKDQRKVAYVVVFFDALIFSTIMKKISGGDGIMFGLAYAVGKLIGTMLGSKLERFMALGILETTIFVNHFDKMVAIADELRDEGYTVETSSVYGYGGRRRFRINILMLRKEQDILKSVLEKHGYDEPTMVVRNVSDIHGKITVNGDIDC